METRLFTKGRVVLPGPIRRRLGLQAGDPLDVRVHSGSVVLTPRKARAQRVSIRPDAFTGLPVLSAGPEAPLLSSEQVRQVLADFPWTYLLLDANALVALGFLQHEFHPRVAAWVRSLVSGGDAELATCSITELAFVRILAQAPQYGIAVSHARNLLLRSKAAKLPQFTFLADDRDLSRLPASFRTAKQTTDGHLAQLAAAKGAVLATLDTRIPRAFLVSEVK